MRRQYEEFRQAKDKLDYELGRLTYMIERFKELIGNSPEPDDEIRRMLEIALRESDAIINALARVAEDEIRVEWSSLLLRNRLDSIIYGIIGGRSLCVRVQNNVQEGFSVLTMWDLMESVLQIILDNSLKAAGKEGRLTVSALLEPGDFRYEIRILNSGYIPDDVRDAVIKRRPVPKGNGAYGIGLLIANSELDLLGGHLEIANTNDGVLTKIIFPRGRWL